MKYSELKHNRVYIHEATLNLYLVRDLWYESPDHFSPYLVLESEDFVIHNMLKDQEMTHLIEIGEL
jgi:hypothetical protein